MRKFLPLLLLASAHLAWGQTTPRPDTVKAGIYIISLHDINFRDKEYTMRFWLWFLHDNPNFEFKTQLDIPNAKEISIQETIPDVLDGKTWEILKMKCTMKQNWSVLDFPFDKQVITMHVENALFDNRSLVFVPDVEGSGLDPKDAIDGWSISNFSVSQSKHNYKTGFGSDLNRDQDFSSFDVTLQLNRSAWGLFLKIFLGMYIAFLIATISFTPHPSEMEPRFGLPVGGLFAAVGNKYIIDSILPESSAFTLVDTLHALTFIGIFGTLLVSAIALKQVDSGKRELAERTNRRGARIIISLYVVANLIFVVLALI